MKSAGQIGYEAYKASTGGKTYDGRDMPTWEQVQANTPHVAKAWEGAAKAIRASIAGRMSEPGVRFPFSVALEHLKNGRRVAREGWNGKGVWLVYVDSVEDFTGTGEVLMVRPSVGMRTADGYIEMSWCASSTDILAGDWMLVQ